MPLDRSQVQPPTLAEKIEPCPALGGDVIVRSLLLSRRLMNDRQLAADRAPREGETEQQARSRAAAAVISRLLHHSVVDPDGAPLMSEAEWDVLGSVHQAEVLWLFSVAMKLNGEDLEEISKNS